MHKLQQAVDAEIEGAVHTVNQLSDRIAQLNREIGIAEGRGYQPHDLRDQRDQLLNELAELVDVRTWEWAGQPDVAAFGDGGVTLSTEPVTISLRLIDGKVKVLSDKSGRELSFSGGRLAGLLEARNEILPSALERLQSFTDTFVRAVDQIQATGLGTGGPHVWLESTRAVSTTSICRSSAPVRDFRLRPDNCTSV